MVDQTSQFYAILTNVGAAKQANADALGIPWTITQMAVGDGNPSGVDNPPLPMPTAAWTSLLNEWRRAPLNQLKVDEKNNAVIVAEQVIPADVGGRWIREIALYDADGDMVAVANCAPTFKPLLSQGSGRTQVVRLNLIVSSSSNVQLKIDPSVVLATREWVTEELAKQDFKHSVLAATTDAITLSGLQTIDGVALPAGSRVLVKNQAAAKDNGLYQVVAGGPWTRCADADTSAKVTPGLLVMVERGTVNSDTAWQLLTDATIALGVTGLTFGLAFGRTGIVAGTYRSVTVDIYGRVVAATNPTTAAGYGLTDVYTKTQVDQALALKAPLVSPTFTGDPKAPTVAATDNDTSIATTAFVRAVLASFGIGLNATGDSVTSSLNAARPTGLYNCSGNAVGVPVAQDGLLIEGFSTGSRRVQIYITTATALFFYRVVPAGDGVYGPWNDVWGSVNTPKMESLSDSTAGRMVTVGGHGVGRGIISTDIDLNNYTTPGNYLTAQEAINLPSGWVTSARRYSLVVDGLASSGHLVQRLTSGMSGESTLTATRSYSASRVWSPWDVQVTEANHIATQTEVNAGVNDVKYVTPKKLRAGASWLLGGNGYIALPTWLGGLIIQWASVTLGSNGSATVSFPIEFPNSAFAGWAGHLAPSGAAAMSTSSYTSKGMTINASTAGTHAVRYLTFGF
ncbi:MAG: phage tail protein [Gammaproteobacteria bacterium]